MNPASVSLHEYKAHRFALVPPGNRTPSFAAIVRREWRRARPQGHYRGDPNWKRGGSSAKGTMALARMLASKVGVSFRMAFQLMTQGAQSRPRYHRRRGR